MAALFFVFSYGHPLYTTEGMGMPSGLRTLMMMYAVCASGCASWVSLSLDEQRATANAYEERILRLAVSMYLSDFYDENELALLSPYPATAVREAKTLGGSVLHPPVSDVIVPAGTRVRVRHLEFPDRGARVRRMLTSPRRQPWLFVEILEGPEAWRTRQAVIVLPRDLGSHEAVAMWLDAVLWEPAQFAAWWQQCSPLTQHAIRHRETRVGMTSEQLGAAQGPPFRWIEDSLRGQPARVAWYPSGEFWLVDGALTSQRPPRALD